MIACMGFGKDPFAKQFWKSAWSWKRPFGRVLASWVWKRPICKAILQKRSWKRPWKSATRVLEKTHACMGFGKDPCMPVQGHIVAGAKGPCHYKEKKREKWFWGWVFLGWKLFAFCFFCGFLCFLIVLFSVCFPFLVLTFLFFFVCMFGFGVCFFGVFLCVWVWFFCFCLSCL